MSFSQKGFCVLIGRGVCIHLWVHKDLLFSMFLFVISFSKTQGEKIDVLICKYIRRSSNMLFLL